MLRIDALLYVCNKKAGTAQNERIHTLRIIYRRTLQSVVKLAYGRYSRTGLVTNGTVCMLRVLIEYSRPTLAPKIKLTHPSKKFHLPDRRTMRKYGTVVYSTRPSGPGCARRAATITSRSNVYRGGPREAIN